MCHLFNIRVIYDNLKKMRSRGVLWKPQIQPGQAEFRRWDLCQVGHIEKTFPYDNYSPMYVLFFPDAQIVDHNDFFEKVTLS